MTTPYTGPRPAILHLVPTLAAGGGELQLLRNIGFFDQDRFEHIVAYIHAPSVLKDDLEFRGVRVECIDPENNKGFFRRVLALRRLLKNLDVRLIHTTNAEADKLGAVTGFLTRTPVAATLNSVAYGDEWYQSIPGLNIWKLRYMKFSRKFALRMFVSRFNAVSEAAKQSFIDTIGIPESKIDVIYRGVDLCKYSKRTERLERSPDTGSSPTILTVGRLVGQKGQKYAIDAMPEILKSFPSAKLQVVGDGYLADSLQQQIDSLNIGHAVTLLGYRSDIPKLLNEADIFVLPSLSEGCPNALLEAMAVGLPCVSAESAAAKEIIVDGESGIFTPLKDSKTIAQAVVKIASDKNLAIELGDGAAKRIRSHFSLEQAALSLESFYTRLHKHAARDVVAEY